VPGKAALAFRIYCSLSASPKPVSEFSLLDDKSLLTALAESGAHLEEDLFSALGERARRWVRDAVLHFEPFDLREVDTTGKVDFDEFWSFPTEDKARSFAAGLPGNVEKEVRDNIVGFRGTLEEPIEQKAIAAGGQPSSYLEFHSAINIQATEADLNLPARLCARYNAHDVRTLPAAIPSEHLRPQRENFAKFISLLETVEPYDPADAVVEKFVKVPWESELLDHLLADIPSTGINPSELQERLHSIVNYLPRTLLALPPSAYTSRLGENVALALLEFIHWAFPGVAEMDPDPAGTEVDGGDPSNPSNRAAEPGASVPSREEQDDEDGDEEDDEEEPEQEEQDEEPDDEEDDEEEMGERRLREKVQIEPNYALVYFDHGDQVKLMQAAQADGYVKRGIGDIDGLLDWLHGVHRINYVGSMSPKGLGGLALYLPGDQLRTFRKLLGEIGIQESSTEIIRKDSITEWEPFVPSGPSPKERAIEFGIQNPDSSNMGFHPEHAKNPFHNILTGAGLDYSHSVVVGHGREDYRLHHAYRLNRDFAIGVYPSKSGAWLWEVSSSSRGRGAGKTPQDLAKYLKNALKKFGEGAVREDLYKEFPGTYGASEEKAMTWAREMARKYRKPFYVYTLGRSYFADESPSGQAVLQVKVNPSGTASDYYESVESLKMAPRTGRAQERLSRIRDMVLKEYTPREGEHTPKQRKHGGSNYVYPPTDKDPYGRYPMSNAKQARNALARAGACDKQSPWMKARGVSCAELKKRVNNAVKKEYPSIEVGEGVVFERQDTERVVQQLFQKYNAKDYFGLQGADQRSIDKQLAFLNAVGSEIASGSISDKTRRMLIDRNNKLMRELFYLITRVDIRRVNRNAAETAISSWEATGESVVWEAYPEGDTPISLVFPGGNADTAREWADEWKGLGYIKSYTIGAEGDGVRLDIVSNNPAQVRIAALMLGDYIEPTDPAYGTPSEGVVEDRSSAWNALRSFASETRRMDGEQYADFVYDLGNYYIDGKGPRPDRNVRAKTTYDFDAGWAEEVEKEAIKVLRKNGIAVREGLGEAKEYALWAKPTGEDGPLSQKLLLGGPNVTKQDVKKVMTLAAKEGWHDFRIQVIDLSKPFNASQAFVNAIDMRAVDRIMRGEGVGVSTQDILQSIADGVAEHLGRPVAVEVDAIGGGLCRGYVEPTSALEVFAEALTHLGEAETYRTTKVVALYGKGRDQINLEVGTVLKDMGGGKYKVVSDTFGKGQIGTLSDEGKKGLASESVEVVIDRNESIFRAIGLPLAFGADVQGGKAVEALSAEALGEDSLFAPTKVKPKGEEDNPSNRAAKAGKAVLSKGGSKKAAKDPKTVNRDDSGDKAGGKTPKTVPTDASGGPGTSGEADPAAGYSKATVGVKGSLFTVMGKKKGIPGPKAQGGEASGAVVTPGVDIKSFEALCPHCSNSVKENVLRRYAPRLVEQDPVSGGGQAATSPANDKPGSVEAPPGAASTPPKSEPAKEPEKPTEMEPTKKEPDQEKGGPTQGLVCPFCGKEIPRDVLKGMMGELLAQLAAQLQQGSTKPPETSGQPEGEPEEEEPEEETPAAPAEPPKEAPETPAGETPPAAPQAEKPKESWLREKAPKLLGARLTADDWRKLAPELGNATADRRKRFLNSFVSGDAALDVYTSGGGSSSISLGGKSNAKALNKLFQDRGLDVRVESVQEAGRTDFVSEFAGFQITYYNANEGFDAYDDQELQNAIEARFPGSFKGMVVDTGRYFLVKVPVNQAAKFRQMISQQLLKVQTPAYLSASARSQVYHQGVLRLTEAGLFEVLEQRTAPVGTGEPGGQIVFSTDVNAAGRQGILGKLVNWFKTRINRVMSTSKVGEVLGKAGKEFGYSIGRTFRGRYVDAEGKTYDEKSLSVEILGVPKQFLLKVGEALAKAFEQEAVLVRSYVDQKPLFVYAESLGEARDITVEMNRYGHLEISDGRKSLYVQRDYDVDSVLDSLTKEEQEEVRQGWEVTIKSREPRYSIFQDYVSMGESKHLVGELGVGVEVDGREVPAGVRVRILDSHRGKAQVDLGGRVAEVDADNVLVYPDEATVEACLAALERGESLGEVAKRRLTSMSSAVRLSALGEATEGSAGRFLTMYFPSVNACATAKSSIKALGSKIMEGTELSFQAEPLNGEAARIRSIAERLGGAVVRTSWPLRVVAEQLDIDTDGADTGEVNNLFQGALASIKGARDMLIQAQTGDMARAVALLKSMGAKGKVLTAIQKVADTIEDHGNTIKDLLVDLDKAHDVFSKAYPDAGNGKEAAPENGNGEAPPAEQPPAEAPPANGNGEAPPPANGNGNGEAPPAAPATGNGEQPPQAAPTEAINRLLGEMRRSRHWNLIRYSLHEGDYGTFGNFVRVVNPNVTAAQVAELYETIQEVTEMELALEAGIVHGAKFLAKGDMEMPGEITGPTIGGQETPRILGGQTIKIKGLYYGEDGKLRVNVFEPLEMTLYADDMMTAIESGQLVAD